MMDDDPFTLLVARAKEKKPVFEYVNPIVQLNAGLWSLFAGATALLCLRLWTKITRRHGTWYDDYILIFSWAVLLANNALIVHQYMTGYVLVDSEDKWDDRMHILINITSCLTLVGQSLTKTAFGVTLLRLSDKRWQQWILWFCIGSMNVYMVVRCIFQWAKLCNEKSYQQWYRLDFCIGKQFREDFKEVGNSWNIAMDFVFAGFPWLITRGLDLRRKEKIGLCLTMSLGIIVAVTSAVRVAWKDDGNKRDPWYIYRNGVSQVWYSSEIAGTIMVQCIPILRPIIRDISTSLGGTRRTTVIDLESKGGGTGKGTTWRTKSSKSENRGSTWGSKSAKSETKRASTDSARPLDDDTDLDRDTAVEKIPMKKTRSIFSASITAAPASVADRRATFLSITSVTSNNPPPPPPPPPKDPEWPIIPSSPASKTLFSPGLKSPGGMKSPMRSPRRQQEGGMGWPIIEEEVASPTWPIQSPSPTPSSGDRDGGRRVTSNASIFVQDYEVPATPMPMGLSPPPRQFMAL